MATDTRRAFIYNHQTREFDDRPFLDIKDGEYFYLCEADGTRVGEFVWHAESDACAGEGDLPSNVKAYKVDWPRSTIKDQP